MNDAIYCKDHSNAVHSQKGGIYHMATVTLRLDDAVKEKIDQFCNETGMNITTFYMLYTNKVL